LTKNNFAICVEKKMKLKQWHCDSTISRFKELDVQAFYFKFVRTYNIEGMMCGPMDVNPII
jgi:hypothetical protein